MTPDQAKETACRLRLLMELGFHVSLINGKIYVETTNGREEQTFFDERATL